MLKAVKMLFAKAGFDVSRSYSYPYDEDGLRSVHNCDFRNKPRFKSAYLKGKELTDGQTA
jgi:hypothetical protein